MQTEKFSNFASHFHYNYHYYYYKLVHFIKCKNSNAILASHIVHRLLSKYWHSH